jgi:hypothetical protein
MSITVYIHYEPEGKEEKTSKIVIPQKWTTTKLVSDVIELFAKSYNSKNADSPIITDEVHFESNTNEKIFSNILCGTVLGDHCDYFIKPGSYVSVNKKTRDEADAGKVRCRNYGCNQYYSPDENDVTSCNHHSGPPVFHDTSKYWSCCPDKKAYDFESFQAILGCVTSPHSSSNTGISLSASPNAVTPPASSQSASSTPAPVLKSISDYNNSNPTAATAASSATKVISASRKSTRSADGLTAKCQRKGCQKTFNVSDNSEKVCIYHKGQPVFHDAGSFILYHSHTHCHSHAHAHAHIKSCFFCNLYFFFFFFPFIFCYFFRLFFHILLSSIS